MVDTFKGRYRKEIMKKIELLIALLTLPLAVIYVIFNGYPNEFVSILIGIICLICGLKVAIEGIKE